MKRNVKLISASLISLVALGVTSCGSVYPFVEELIPTYRVRFYDSEDKVNLIYEVDDVKEHENVVFPSDKTPTKEEDVYASYSFSGWDKSLDNITENTDYIAQYTETAKYYTVTYKNWDEEVLYTDRVKAGEASSYEGNTPQKISTSEHQYTFTGWDVSSSLLDHVVSNITTYAQYKSDVRTYTVKFLMDDQSTVIKVEDVEYNGFATAPTSPTKESVVDSTGNYQVAYTFASWDKDPATYNIVSDVNFVASFTSAQELTAKGRLKQHITGNVESTSDGMVLMNTDAAGTAYYLRYVALNDSFAYYMTTDLDVDGVVYKFEMSLGFKNGVISNGSYILISDSNGNSYAETIFTPEVYLGNFAQPQSGYGFPSDSSKRAVINKATAQANGVFTKLEGISNTYFTMKGLEKPY